MYITTLYCVLNKSIHLPGGIGWNGFWWTTSWIFPASNTIQVSN